VTAALMAIALIFCLVENSKGLARYRCEGHVTQDRLSGETFTLFFNAAHASQPSKP
jgi:hypothetical protein